VVVERPGFGWSDPKPNITFLEFAADVEQLMQHLAVERFGVMGYSAGSPWALAVAYKMPDKITNVAVISSLAPRNAPKNTQGMPAIFKLAYFLASKAPSVLASIVKQTAGDYQKNPVKAGRTDFGRYHKADYELYTKAEYEELFLRSAMEIYSHPHGWVAEAHEYRLWCLPWGFELKDIQSRVGVWHGKLDRGTTRNMSKFLTSQLPNNQQFFIEDCGHLIFFSQYEEIVRFLCA